jgi:hypothetical protein
MSNWVLLSLLLPFLPRLTSFLFIRLKLLAFGPASTRGACFILFRNNISDLTIFLAITILKVSLMTSSWRPCNFINFYPQLLSLVLVFAVTFSILLILFFPPFFNKAYFSLFMSFRSLEQKKGFSSSWRQEAVRPILVRSLVRIQTHSRPTWQLVELQLVMGSRWRVPRMKMVTLDGMKGSPLRPHTKKI